VDVNLSSDSQCVLGCAYHELNYEEVLNETEVEICIPKEGTNSHMHNFVTCKGKFVPVLF
jgi:hypothetical protein